MTSSTSTAKTIYAFTTTNNKGEEVPLSRFEGKVLLIVNTASKCGFTNQYKGLQELYTKYQPLGLEILAFPCNQFGKQEPGDDNDIKQFCEMNYQTTFPLFSKIDVNGDDTHPLFQFLKESQPGILGTEMIKWNFTKFLVDRGGIPIKRYAPQDTPESLQSDIENALQKA